MGNSFDLQSILSSVSKIRLPGGMVGKVCTVLVVVAICMAAISWSVKLVWVSALTAVLLFVLCFVMLWRVINFADRNPQAAILEGAEFLMHEQLMLGTKANPEIKAVIEEYTEAHVVTLSPAQEKNVLQPDPPIPQLPGDASKSKEVSNG
ncbi:MAG: hypothetical protein AB1512_19505 [Thermodesulfobacteriota bacterium]